MLPHRLELHILNSQPTLEKVELIHVVAFVVRSSYLHNEGCFSLGLFPIIIMLFYAINFLYAFILSVPCLST